MKRSYTLLSNDFTVLNCSPSRKESACTKGHVHWYPNLLESWVRPFMVKPKGGGIAKIRGLGQCDSQIQPYILGMSLTCGLYSWQSTRWTKLMCLVCWWYFELWNYISYIALSGALSSFSFRTLPDFASNCVVWFFIFYQKEKHHVICFACFVVIGQIQLNTFLKKEEVPTSNIDSSIEK